MGWKSSMAANKPLPRATNMSGGGSPEGAEVQTCTLFSPLWALFGTFLARQRVTTSPPQRRREQRIKSRWMLKSISCKIPPKHRVTARAAHGNPNPSERIAGIRKRREFLRLRVLKAQPQLKRRIPALRANRRMQGNRRGRLPVIQRIRIAVASAVKKRNVTVWLMKRNAKHVPIRQKLISPEKPALQPSAELNSQILRAVQHNRTADAAVCAIHIGGIGVHGGGKQHGASSLSANKKRQGKFLHLPPKSPYFIRSSSSARRAS